MTLKKGGILSSYVVTGVVIKGRWGYTIEVTDSSTGEVLQGEIETIKSNDPEFTTEASRLNGCDLIHQFARHDESVLKMRQRRANNK